MAKVRNLVNGSLKLIDGTTPTPNELTIPIEEGNLSWTEDDTAPVIKNRGKLAGFADPIENAVELTWTMIFEEYTGKTTSGAAVSPVDFLKKKGAAAAFTGTRTCGPYTIDAEFTVAKPSNCDDPLEQKEVLTFADFHTNTIAFEEGEEMDTIVITGTALITTPAAVRS